MAGAIQDRVIGAGCVVASYNGTAAALYLNLGFIPTWARALNYTDGDAGWSWMYGMTADTCVGEGGALVSVASGGITTLDGSAGNGIGLTIGTDTTYVNETGKTYFAVFGR